MTYQEQVEQSMGKELQNSDDMENITVLGAGKGNREPDEEVQEDLQPEDQQSEETEETEETVEEEPKYGKDQVQKIIQTRVNTYNKRIEKLTPYKNAIDKICEITGLDFDSLASKLGAMTAEQQAQLLGVPVAQVQMAQQTRLQMSQERGKNQQLSRQLEEVQLKADKRYHDFDLYKEEVDELLDENPKLTVKQAYLLVKGDTAIEAAARDAEQLAIAKQVNSSKKTVVKPGGTPANQSPKISPDVLAAAKMVGMDPVEYLKYQSIDNIDAYRASKKK